MCKIYLKITSNGVARTMWHMSVARTEIAAKAPPAGGCNLCLFSKMPKLSSGASRVAIARGWGQSEI